MFTPPQPLVDGQFSAPPSLVQSIMTRPDGGYSGAGVRDKNGNLIARRGFPPHPQQILPNQLTPQQPVVMPQNPVASMGQIPPLAHLRQAMTQLHAMQMAQRMAKHSVLHAGG